MPFFQTNLIGVQIPIEQNPVLVLDRSVIIGEDFKPFRVSGFCILDRISSLALIQILRDTRATQSLLLEGVGHFYYWGCYC